MRINYSWLLALGTAIASLSSCSRATYSFNTTAPAYLGSEQVHTVTKVAPAVEAASVQVAEAAPTATATTAEVVPTVEPTAAHQAATALAQHSAAVATPKAAETTAAAPQRKLDHATRKALRQELKKQLAAAPKGQQAGGKSQLVAALLCFFLGGLGIHRFYLGYTGLGILYIVLALTSFLIIPGIALFVLVIIDLIRILTGSLKPKDGDYAKTL